VRIGPDLPRIVRREGDARGRGRGGGASVAGADIVRAPPPRPPMPLLSLGHVSVVFGDRPVLDDLVLKVEPGDRIGVIGQNGAGKSTLLKVLAGQLDPSAGTVVRQRGLRIAHQAQELVAAPGATVFAEMRRVFGEDLAREERLRAIEHRLAEHPPEDEKAALLAEYDRLHHEQVAAKSFDVDRRIASVLTSLGLAEPVWEREIASFSGGERNVIGLARAILSRPDVMLLDEPSNHLDMDGVEWFIDFLRESDAAVVMVSHNRHLLDATVRGVWEVRHARVTEWTGNYSDFQRLKAEALALQERQYETQQRLIRRIEFQARRLMDMANAYDDPGQAKRAKAMLRRIERIERIEKPDRGERRFFASLGGGGRHGRIALHVNDFSFAYGDRVLFDRASLEVEFGERVCLVGPNGSGKTTLFRQLLDHGGWENPTLRLGKSVRAGEYRQLHDLLDPSLDLLRWAMDATRLDRSAAAKLLHRFLFTFDDLERPIGTLSGGEKSRLQLARLAHAKVNLLLLDEPTNHLDIQACEQLEEMLEEYDGTLLVISHDRYFLDRIVTRVVELQERSLVSRPGTFAAWWVARRAERRRFTALESRGTPESGGGEAKARREAQKALQREQNRLRTELSSLEARIHALEEQVAELTRRMEEAWEGGGDHRLAAALNADLARVRDELQTLYPRWEELAGTIGEA